VQFLVMQEIAFVLPVRRLAVCVWENV